MRKLISHLKRGTVHLERSRLMIRSQASSPMIALQKGKTRKITNRQQKEVNRGIKQLSIGYR